ncbi:ceramidase [Orrella daihaiensis]|uniref:Ceramidase n=1 Tax=Orrella daihaiensis TaxID=2782176 RepID=A0ABY4APW8_9BURK|nr:ceramidase [Orrella daihaiensis]UOD51082.1 hypothetical protein DHf2319_04035 [Orrella daihaiensis]
MTDWFQPADIYCERTDPSFWAEPVNAWTNLAFVIAGLFVLAHREPPARTLALLIVLIGAGSFLFHTFANRLTGFLDVLFIGVYLVTYAWLWPKWVTRSTLMVKASSVTALILLIATASIATHALTSVLPDLPPGSYLGAWFYVIGLATLSATNHRKVCIWLWVTAGLFMISMTARQLDLPLCEQIGGTHWLWHVLNATVLYASARALLLGASDTASRTDAKD